MSDLSITRALAKISSLDAKLSGPFIFEVPLVGVAVGEGEKEHVHDSVENPAELSKRITAHYQRIQAFVQLRQKLKALVVESNAKTVVSIGGKEMSVAAALEFRKVIEQRQTLLSHMQKSYTDASKVVRNLSTQLDAAVKACRQNWMASVKADATNVETSALIESLVASELENGTPKLVDPLNIAEKIRQVSEEIQRYVTEVNFVLNESNASTKITLDDQEHALSEQV